MRQNGKDGCEGTTSQQKHNAGRIRKQTVKTTDPQKPRNIPVRQHSAKIAIGTHEVEQIKKNNHQISGKDATMGGHEQIKPDDVKMSRGGGITVPGRCGCSVRLLKFSCPLEPADAPEHEELSGEISALARRSRA